MAIEVVPYAADKATEWDAFVDHSNNGTLFHRQSFLAYHAPGRFNFQHLMFYVDGKLAAVLPGAVTGEMYKSPAGASFGGLVVEKYLSIETADQLVKACIRWCADHRIKEIYLTPPMQVYHETFDEVVDYALHYNHFLAISALYSSVIDFTRIHDKQDLSQNTRHKVNTAINKGVRIEERNDFDLFYPIMLKNKSKFEAVPTHTLAELKALDQLVPGHLKLFMAYHEDVPIAGQLLFVANKTCVLNFYTMHLYEYRNLFSVNYLIEHAIRWCNAQGFKYYDYGVSADTFSIDPMEPSWSLIQFKESMRACGCQRKTYYRRVF
jgi:hypothetical protein